MPSLASDKRASAAPSPRGLALQILLQVTEQGQSLSQALESGLDRLDNPRDKAFCAELCFGVCRFYFLLKDSVDSRLKKPLKPRDGDIRLIIMLGLYQIRFTRVSDHAAVNETVKLLARLKKAWAKGLVNAMLRNFLRAAQAQAQAEPTTSELSADEQIQAYPQWMRQQLQQDWAEHALAIMSAGNRPAPLMLRVDLNQVERDDYLNTLAEASIAARAHAYIDTAIVLDKAVAVDVLPGFASAQVSVQDAAAQIAAPLLDCRPGMLVLDACAAPGGKTLHLLQATADIELVALDKDQSRLQKVQQNLDRGGVSAQLVCADAATPQDWYQGKQFDRILLDAPCSASGIIRRHPDIRILRKASDIAALAQQQQRLLTTLWPLLKPGGRLLYSTCSVFKEENEDQVAAFLQQRKDGFERPIDGVEWGESRSPGRQILPGFNDMDGFYYACLEKAG